MQGTARMRRLLPMAIVIALAISLVIPTVALAVPTPTIRLSTSYQPVAAKLKISGYLGTRYKGRPVTVQIKKPGRTFWSTATPKDVTIRDTGYYRAYYTPMLAGKYYVRTRYANSKGTTYSRTASFTVAKGPGEKYEILLGSTTSTRDAGLWEALKPLFLKSCPEYTVKATFVGSGAAIALGGSGNADVLLVHSPSQEVDLMNGIVAGTPSAYRGKTRFKVMYNDYVLVGDKNDPANIDTTEPAVSAFQKIASTESTFWSRNDKSGTNTKEKEIWALCTPPNPQIETADPLTYKPWYKASGTMGMAQALAATNNTTGSYTLSDRGTWLNAKQLGMTGNLAIINEGDSNYFNQYSVIEIDGAKNWQGAQDFSRWIRTAAVQEVIRTYGVDTSGQALFVPNAGSW